MLACWMKASTPVLTTQTFSLHPIGKLDALSGLNTSAAVVHAPPTLPNALLTAWLLLIPQACDSKFVETVLKHDQHYLSIQFVLL
jgi:hypothetical protein